MGFPLVVERADELAEVLSMLANPKRLAIMCHLTKGELSVGAIADLVNLSQSALSQHLAKLRSSGMVTTRRERQMIYYSCAPGPVPSLLAAIEEVVTMPPPQADGIVMLNGAN